LGALLAAPAAASAQSIAPGFWVQVYASVTDPTRLAFAPDGTLYTGRDNTGSGGGAGDAVRIHRIGPGGSPTVEYGLASIPDPDALVVDVNGVVGSAGSVLVGGIISVAVGGRITQVALDQSVTPLFTTTAFDNPSEMLFDSGGRLLFSNFANPGTASGVYQSTGAVPTPLFTTTSQLAYLALDELGRVFVSAADGTIRIYSSTGTLINGAFATGLGAGVPLAIGPLGGLPSALFIATTSGELRRIDSAGNSITLGLGYAASDLQFGPDGALYVAELSKDRVLRIAPAAAIPLFGRDGWLLLGLCVFAVSFWSLSRAPRGSAPPAG
jgi:hypothetical protein